MVKYLFTLQLAISDGPAQAAYVTNLLAAFFAFFVFYILIIVSLRVTVDFGD